MQLPDGQVHHDTHVLPMGNYVIEVGNTVIVNPSQLGNYVIADTPGRVLHDALVVKDTDIATHTDPVGRARTNYIARLDLTEHGMPGKYEQMWTRTNDRRLFELCCIPFFPYGPSRDTCFSDLLAAG